MKSILRKSINIKLRLKEKASKWLERLEPIKNKELLSFMLKILSILLKQMLLERQESFWLKLKLTKKNNILLLILKLREFRPPQLDLLLLNPNALLWSKKLKLTRIAKKNYKASENLKKTWLSLIVFSNLLESERLSSLENKVSKSLISLTIQLTTLVIEILKKQKKNKNEIINKDLPLLLKFKEYNNFHL